MHFAMLKMSNLAPNDICFRCNRTVRTLEGVLMELNLMQESQGQKPMGYTDIPKDRMLSVRFSKQSKEKARNYCHM